MSTTLVSDTGWYLTLELGPNGRIAPMGKDSERGASNAVGAERRFSAYPGCYRCT